jgi:transposase
VSGTPGVPDDAAGLRLANARLRELLGERDAEIAALRSLLAELDELRKQGAELQAQVADLAARLRQNSSRPPSQDGPGKAAPKSLRTKTGRKPGRPEGQPGATMQLSDHPDR